MRLKQKICARVFTACLVVMFLVVRGSTARADDGYRLWLRYDSVPARSASIYRKHLTAAVVSGNSATMREIRTELINGCTGLLGKPEIEKV